MQNAQDNPPKHKQEHTHTQIHPPNMCMHARSVIATFDPPVRKSRMKPYTVHTFFW